MKKRIGHDLLRLAASLKNKPHLITASAFNVVLDYLDNRNNGAQFYDEWDQDVSSDSPKPKTYENGLGVLKVEGSLTHRPLMTLCGEVGTSYTSLLGQVEEMAEAGVKTIVMEVNSGGGQSACCFEFANEIRSVCDENDIKLIGYASNTAASAAFALLVVCDIVVANPSADVGSVGCVVCLVNNAQAMAQEGYKRVFISSAASKVPFDDAGEFKEDFISRLQSEVDRLGMEFSQHVSKYTGLSVDAVLATEAKMYNAPDALALGFVNKILTTKQFAAYVADIHQGAMYA